MAADRPSREARSLTRTALALWLVTAVASVAETLAAQYPESPFHVGVLPGPWSQLQSFSFALGTLLLGLSFLWPWLYGERGRAMAALLIAAAILHVSTLAYAALHGVMAIQILDPRPSALWLIALRGGAHALTMIALADAGVRALRR